MFFKWKNIVLAAALLTFLSVAGYCAQKLKIVATTTHISVIAKAIGKDNVEVTTLIPGGSCPGHFDLEPAMAKNIAKADIFISHSWDKRFDNVLDGINNKRLVREYTKTQGNWMVPDVNIEAAREVLMILEFINPDKSKEYEKNCAGYIKEVQSRLKVILAGAGRLKGVKVICSKHQEEFLKWLGMDISASYERAEDLNIRNISDVMKKAKEEKAVLIVDNLQSGTDTGVQLAKDLGIAHITLTNFPENGSYLQTLADNIKNVQEVLK